MYHVLYFTFERFLNDKQTNKLHEKINVDADITVSNYIYFWKRKTKTCEAARIHPDSSNNSSIHLSNDHEHVNPAQEFMSPELVEVSTSNNDATNF